MQNFKEKKQRQSDRSTYQAVVLHSFTEIERRVRNMSAGVERRVTGGGAKRDGAGVEVHEADVLLDQVDDFELLHEDGHDFGVAEGQVVLV